MMLVMSLRKRDATGIIRFVMGLAIALIGSCTYHQFLAAPGNIVDGAGDMLPRLLDMTRFQTVLVFFLKQTYLFGSPAYAYAIRFSLRSCSSEGLTSGMRMHFHCPSIFLLQYAAYFAVYLITPLDLLWHLNSSMPRVFVHIAPLLAFAVFSLVREQNLFPCSNSPMPLLPHPLRSEAFYFKVSDFARFNFHHLQAGFKWKRIQLIKIVKQVVSIRRPVQAGVQYVRRIGNGTGIAAIGAHEPDLVATRNRQVAPHNSDEFARWRPGCKDIFHTVTWAQIYKGFRGKVI